MNKLVSLAFFSLCTVLAATSLRAHRFGFPSSLDGKPVEGSEVCFWPGKEGTARSLYFSTPVAQCLPADKVIDIPNGTWHFFGRHPKGYIYVHRTYTVTSGRDTPHDYREVELSLEPAATLDVADAVQTLSENEHLVLWFDDGSGHLGTAIPIDKRSRSAHVAADRGFVAILVRDGNPVRVSDAMTLAPGQTMRLTGFVSKQGVGDVIAWVQLTDESLNAVRAPEHLSKFTSSLHAKDGSRIKPLFEIRYPRSANYALQIFKDVPIGDAHVVLEGATWKRHVERFTVTPGATLLDKPLIANAAAAVKVTWAYPGTGGTSSCTADTTPRAVKAALFACDNDACSKSIADVSLPLNDKGEQSFGGLEPGRYQVWLKVGALPVEKRDVLAQRGTIESLQIDGSSLFLVKGSVSRDGKPIRTQIAFINGRTASDELGRFETLLPTDPKANLVQVTDCSTGRTFTHFPKDGEIGPATKIDINSRDFRLKVSGPSRVPLTKVATTLIVLKENGKGAYFTQSVNDADKDGIFVHAVPQGRKFRLCAEAEGFAAECTEDFKDDGAAESAEIKLAKRLKTGTVRTSVPLLNGSVYFVSPNGTIIEEASVSPLGEFKYVHEPMGAYAVVVSDNAPLNVASIETSDAVVTINVQDAAPRDVAVRSSRNARYADALVGVRINGMLVPTNVLIDHQGRRGADVRLRDEGLLVLTALPSNRTLEIGVGPSLEVERSVARGTDVFVSPTTVSGIEWKRATDPAVTFP